MVMDRAELASQASGAAASMARAIGVRAPHTPAFPRENRIPEMNISGPRTFDNPEEIASKRVRRGISAQELRAKLIDLGWSQAELARRLGVRPSLVSNWCSGKTAKVPPPVFAYVELAGAIRDAMGEVARLLGA